MSIGVPICWILPSFMTTMVSDSVRASSFQKGRVRKARKLMTEYTVGTAMDQFEVWKKLEELLLVKFIDGNVKAQNEDGSFKHSKYHSGTPEGLTQPGYTDFWKEAVAKSAHGSVLEEK